MNNRLIICLILLVFAVKVHADEAQQPVSDKDASYNLGLVWGARIKNDFTKLDFDALLRGFKDAYTKEDISDAVALANLQLQQYQQQLRAEIGKAAAEVGSKFRSENGKKKGVVTTATGLQYEVLQAGEGEQPKATDTVTVHYRGTLISGKEFDSSYGRGEPATFPLNGVIPGWTEGVQLMKVGSKYRFVIPPDLAYGDRGAGPNIGPNETLIFEVELLSITGG